MTSAVLIQTANRVGCSQSKLHRGAYVTRLNVQILGLFGGLLLSFLTACGDELTRTDDILALDGDVSEGQVLFEANCAGCHGEDGRSGSIGINIVSHVGHHGDGYLVDLLLDGRDGMPAFGESLSDQEIADVISFLHTL